MKTSFEGPLLAKKWCFSEAHLSTLREKYGDQHFIQRALFVGEYLSQLREAGLDPIFKGGSSLMFLLPDFRRLSEDIDIAVKDLGELESALSKVKERLPGFSFRKEKRKGIHYQLDLMKPAAGYIILDAVEKGPEYAMRSIKLKSALYESDVRVRVPTLNALLGDKLTTHGRRIGLQLYRRPAKEHAKQLYDLGILLHHLDDFKELAVAFRSTVSFQCQYREKDCSPEEALDDFAEVMRRFIVTPPNAGVPKRWEKAVSELRRGLEHLPNFLERGNRFGTSHARLEAARLLFFSRILLRNLGGERVRVPAVHRALDDMPSALQDERLIEKASEIVGEQEPELFSRDLQNGAPDALLFIAAYHEPELLLE